jgi:glutaredoxin
MSSTQPASLAQKATEKLFAVLNRADEVGGEVRDFVQERVVADHRYIAMRKRVAKLLGKSFISKTESQAKAVQAETKRAQSAAVTPAQVAPTSAALGKPGVPAQIYGKKSCPWTGRAITLLEKHKVDFDYVDLEEPENEKFIPRLSTDTKQATVPYVYLRGQFIGGFNALSEVERLGQLEVALMSAEQRKSAPAHLRSVEIAARPNTDEVAPADADASAE